MQGCVCWCLYKGWAGVKKIDLNVYKVVYLFLDTEQIICWKSDYLGYSYRPFIYNGIHWFGGRELLHQKKLKIPYLISQAHNATL